MFWKVKVEGSVTVDSATATSQEISFPLGVQMRLAVFGVTEATLMLVTSGHAGVGSHAMLSKKI